jgi:hypothetical protein
LIKSVTGGSCANLNARRYCKIKELRGAGPDVPVLAFTVGRNSPLRAQALRTGADQVLNTATSGEKIVRAAQLLVGG